MKEKVIKTIKAGGAILCAYAMLKSCQGAAEDFMSKQQELDKLCGQDRSLCLAQMETLCIPSFGGGVLECTEVTNYVPVTPVSPRE